MEEPVVIITGANNGIGFHMTRDLLKNQHCVAGFDLSGENLDSLMAEYPDRLRFYPCDVADHTQVESAVEQVIGEWGRIDILVNNAALAIFAPFEEKSPEDTRREFEVNYFGYLHTIRAVLPHMKAQGQGIIHNFGSGVGITGFPGIYGYVSTKGAIESLTRTLALEFEPFGIHVTLMHPPLTRTQSSAPLGIPPQMMADPEQVGRQLARQIRSIRPVITSGLQSSIGLWMMRLFPTGMGRLLSRAALRARADR